MRLEDELRGHLHQLADEGGSTERLRARVRARLEAFEEGTAFLEAAPPPPRSRPLWNVAAAVVLVVAGVGAVVVWLASGGGDTDIASDSIPRPASESVEVDGGQAGSPAGSEFSVDVPTDGAVSVQPSGETERVATYEVGGGSLSSAGQIVFAVPEIEDDPTVDAQTAVVDRVVANLAQVELVDVTDATLGDQPTIRVRLRSSQDMSLVGFRLGDRTFLSASGIDREYELHVLARPDGGALAVWIDAPTGELDEVRDAADAMARSLVWLD